MKRKLVSFLLAVATCATLAGCKGNVEPGNDPAVATEAPQPTPEAVTNDGPPTGNVTTAEPTAEAAATEAPTAEETPTPTEETSSEITVPDGIVEVPLPAEVSIPDNDAMAFVRDMKVGWNLGNTFDATNCTWLSDPMEYESAWCGAKTTQALIKEIHNAGFNTIRIPVSWHNHVDGSYNIDGKWMDRVQEVVDWAYDDGMYVIINIHHDNEDAYEYPSNDKMNQSKKYVTKIWAQIADRFADYDEHLIYESMNEPRQVGTDHEWWINDKNSATAKECFDCVNQLNQAIVDTIRANGKGYNGSRYIMVPGYCANPEFELINDFVLPDDSKATAENRIIVSVHAYTPYAFALDLSGTSEFDIAARKGTGDISSFMKRLYEKFVVKGIPVVIGEFGALEKNGNDEARKQFAAYYVAMARHYGLTTVWWDNNAHNASGECFQLINRSAMTWTYPEIRDQIIYYSE